MPHKARDFRVISGCPCPASVAPMVWLVLRKAGMTAESIYRGSDAVGILHAHGKHTQHEIHIMFPNISNPEGESQHDLHSDGNANPGPVGRPLKEWEIGIDSGTNSQASKDRITHAGQHYGFMIRHPYHRGVEGHHWCFGVAPWARNRRERMKYAAIRAMLPRR